MFRKIDAANGVHFPFQLYEFVLLWSRQGSLVEAHLLEVTRAQKSPF